MISCLIYIRNRIERGVWQHRFWQHTIKDELDYQRHMDYIHVNPCQTWSG